MKKEIMEFNVMRALAITIILVHHLPNFIYNFFNLKYLGIPVDLTCVNDLNRYFGLGIFIFISGFLLEINTKGMNGFKDASSFLLKRYIRIIPLYLVAYILFVFLFRDTIEHLNLFSVVAHVLGLQVILSSKYCDTVMTLWYVGLIIAYYFVFMIVSLYGKSKLKTTIILCAILVAWLLARMILGFGDQRFVLYLPVFISGILAARMGLLNKINLKHVLLSLGLLVLLAILYVNKIYPQTVLFIPVKPALFSLISFSGILVLNAIMFLTVIIVYFLSGLSNAVKNNKAIAFISYSSFCMYLFHRPIITLLLDLWRPSNQLYKALYVILCALPLIVIAGYFIQKQYDAFVLPRIKHLLKL